MDLGDISARFKKVRSDKAEDSQEDKPYNYDESYRLRGKMLGVLIRDARLNAARTIEDCARLLNISPQEFNSWEYGEDVPGLPHLELLAYYLDVPISHFWGQDTLNSDKSERQSAQEEYIKLRDRMIGALLQNAREEANLTIEDIHDATQIPIEVIQSYELGLESIPMHHLSVLSNAVNRRINYFVETSGYVGRLLQMREEWKQFSEMSEEVRAFVANPLNIGFIHIAMSFSKMPTDELRQIAEGMLEITM